MVDRFSSARIFFVRAFLGISVLVLPACAPTPVSASTQAPQTLPTCVSPSLNPYRSYQPPTQVTNIFTNYRNGFMTYDSARQDAFSQLGEHIKQWSDYKDIFIDEQHMVRISITYLEPILVQYIVLNYALKPPNSSMDTNWFTSQIQTAMDNLAKRDEIIFIVIITSPVYENTIHVTFPIKDLKLVNTSGRQVSTTHSDPILNERINIKERAVYGFVGYPVSLSLQDTTCAGVVDQWTTSLALDLKSISDEKSPFYGLSWNIPYQSPVVLQGNSHPVPTIDPSYNVNRFTEYEMPPIPAMNSNDTGSKAYWEELGRYIWKKVLMVIEH